MSSSRLKGCPAENINRIVRNLVCYNEIYREKLLEFETIRLSNTVVNTYTIKDCISIIISTGDLFDAIKKSEGIELDMNDKLIYHRQLAIPFVKDWIENKINEKLFLLKTKKDNEERICSICFEEITNTTITVTKCKHAFHKCCLSKWAKNTCPMCRSNISR
jgi:hypothetical protein